MPSFQKVHAAREWPPRRTQESQKVMQPQGESPRPWQAMDTEILKAFCRSRQKQPGNTENGILVPSRDPSRKAPEPRCKAEHEEVPKSFCA